MPNRHGSTIDGKTGKPEPPPRQCRTRPLKLDSLRAIRDEMGRVYREMRSGKIEAQVGTRLVYVLTQMREMAMAIEIDERITALEERNETDEQHHPALRAP